MQSSVDRVGELLRSVPPEARTVRLSLGLGAVSLTRFALAAFAGFILFAGAHVLAFPFIKHGCAGEGEALIGAVAAIALEVVRLRRRQGRVTIEYDEDGIRELEDGAPRVAIPWSSARAHPVQLEVRRDGHRLLAEQIWFARPDGAVIYLKSYDRRQYISDSHYACVTDRPVPELLAIASVLPRLDRKPRDPRERTYGFLGWIGLAGTVYLMWAIVQHTAFRVTHPTMSRNGLPALSAAFAVAALLMLLPPWLRLRRVRLAQREEHRDDPYRSPAAPAHDDRFAVRSAARELRALTVRAALAIVLITYPFTLRFSLRVSCRAQIGMPGISESDCRR